MSERGTGAESPTGGPIGVYVVDDHELVRRGVCDVLDAEDDIRVVGQSGSAIEGLEQILELRPDVALLDGRLPDGSGTDMCRQLAAQAPEVATLILTMYDDEEQLFAAIIAGAAGYLLKGVRSVDLVDAVRRVAAGQCLLDPGLTPTVLERIRSGEGVPVPATDRLTGTEEEILDLLGEGLTNRQIAHRLGLAEKTVKNYVSILLGKLQLESRTQAAIFAIKRRYDPAVMSR